MAVVEVQLKDEESGTSKGKLSGTRVYWVQVDDNDDDSETARTADDGTTAIPSTGEAFKSGSSAKAVDIKAKRMQNDKQFFYEVTVTYSANKKDQDEAIETPTSRPPKINARGLSQRQTYFSDVNDDLVVNSAGDPPEQLPERSVAEGISFSIQRNMASDLTATLQGLLHTLNSGSVTIKGIAFSASTLRLDDYSVSDSLEENGTTFYDTSITIVGQPTFDDEYEDRGRFNSSGETKQNADGSLIDVPWPLDGAGAFKTNRDDAPATITRVPYEVASWAAISGIWTVS